MRQREAGSQAAETAAGAGGRRRRPWWRWAVAGALAGALGAAAGAQVMPDVTAPAEALPPTPVMQVYGTSAAADPVGPGDLLDVRIFGQPQLSGSLRVGSDGMVAPPFVATLEVGGKTPAEIERMLGSEYGTLLLHPMVSVRVAEVNSRKVAVNGEVPRPGMYAFSGRLTLLQALSLAGGIDPVKASQRIYLLHATPPQAATDAQGTATYSVNSTLETIDVSQLSRHPELNREIAPGDVIDVPEAHRVFISGDVMHPGEASLRPGMTVTQLVSQSGGLLPQANPARVRVLRVDAAGTGRTEIYVNVGAVQHNRGQDVALEPDDIVLVPGQISRMVGLELLDFFTGTERWRVQQTVADTIP